MNKPHHFANKHINNLIRFRQANYQDDFIRLKDAQFELLDVLLSSGSVRSFPELSLNPVFRRRWPSAYAAIGDGEQDCHRLRRYSCAQPTHGVQVKRLCDEQGGFDVIVGNGGKSLSAPLAPSALGCACVVTMCLWQATALQGSGQAHRSWVALRLQRATDLDRAAAVPKVFRPSMGQDGDSLLDRPSRTGPCLSSTVPSLVINGQFS